MCGAPSLIERLTAKTHGRRDPLGRRRSDRARHVVVGPAAEDEV